MHVLIPDGLPSSPALQQALAGVQRPAWRKLQRRLAPGAEIVLDEMAWSTPHEVALARALGLPDAPGLIPWAAHETQTIGQPCAFITPCHWQVHSDHLSLSDPAQLPLSEAESQALLALFQTYFAQDGVTLRHLAPGAWLATGEVFRNLPSASLARAVGRNIDAWMPPTSEPRGAALRRLQNEMQMLLYTHALNDERAARGLQPVNSFWVSGAGELPSAAPIHSPIQIDPRLLRPAMQGDLRAYAQAWQALDTEVLAPLLGQIARGQSLQITLSNERSAQTWGPAQTGLRQRFLSIFSRLPA
jgi:hypothetical protein